MGLIAKETGGGGFDPVEAGMHQAVCIGVIDLGTHYSQQYKKSARKVAVQWEIPTQRIEVNGEEAPRTMTKTYTLSLHERAGLRKDLESWRGKPFTETELQGFDLTNLIGVNCLLNVAHEDRNGKTYANIKSITPMMKGMQPVQPELPRKYYSFDDGGPIPEGLPEWLIKIMYEADEANGGSPTQAQQAQAAPSAVQGMDQLPF